MDVVGSKPGDPLGSILFNYLAVAVLGDVARKSEEAGLLTVLPPPPVSGALSALQRDGPPLALSDVTYADDSVFFLAPGPALGVHERAVDRGVHVSAILPAPEREG